MNVLLVAATPLETKGLVGEIGFENVNGIFQLKTDKHQFSLLHTGIGMVNTAYLVAKYIATNPRPDMAIHFGIAGSFDRQIPLGAVVEIIEDNFSELGAEDNGNFLDLAQMGFPISEIPLLYNKITNPSPSHFSLLKTTAITVNTVHGEQSSIENCQKIWNKQIETMESAAFFQIMYLEKIPFYSFRSISNYVEPRNRANWQIGLAVKNMQNFIMELIQIFP